MFKNNFTVFRKKWRKQAKNRTLCAKTVKLFLNKALDKSWHGIHFLLTGRAKEGEEPLCYLVKGGEEIGDEDVGYCPPRALRPNQIADWAEALSAISSDDLRKRYDAKAMMEIEICPTIWDRVTEEDGYPEYLLENYEWLRSIVEQMKSENKGAIIYFT